MQTVVRSIRNARRRNRDATAAACRATIEPLEARQMMAVDVFQASDIIPNGTTLATSGGAKIRFGFFRQGAPGDARSIEYLLANPTGEPLRATSITVPNGFEILEKPAPSFNIPDGEATTRLVIRLDKTKVGVHQGNVVINSSDGEQHRFEIGGTVGNFAAGGANELGSLGSVSRAGTMEFEAETDFSGSAVLNPGVEVFHFDLAAPRSDVTLTLRKLAGADEFFVNMSLFRDANDDGVLQVSEENAIFPTAHVEGVSAADPGPHVNVRTGALDAGSYLAKVSGPSTFPNFGTFPIAFNFTIAATPQPDPEIVVQVAGRSAVVDGDTSPSDGDGTDLGVAAVGSVARREFVIRNAGDAVLQLNPAAFLGSNNGFSIDAGLPPTLAPGASAVLGIRMNTDAAGERSARVIVPTNDPRATQFDFAVGGSVGEEGGGARLVGGAPPTATLLSAPKHKKRGVDPYQFKVRYNGPSKIDKPTVGGADITVTGPGGFVSGVELVAKKQKNGGRRVDATYRLAARGGNWERGDNGVYTIVLNGEQVFDRGGLAAAEGTVGQFTVKIKKKKPTVEPQTVAAPRREPMAVSVFSKTAVRAEDEAVWIMA